MPAYIIVQISVRDAKEYEEYKLMTPASLENYGGKFIVRGGQTETLEGSWQPGRLVVLQFPTAQKARDWWNSEEYAPAKKLRQRVASTEMILVQGVETEM
jgi:uncharacterized protein (DUF1330 family)